MKYLLYMIIVAVAVCIPVRKQDVAKLKPVELVSVYTQSEEVVLATDTGDVGVGRTLSLAYENLELTTPGVIYLDTAKFLLITEDAMQMMQPLSEYLKPSVFVCLQDEPVDPGLAAKYLVAQENLPKLKDVKAGMDVPKLQQIQKRLIFLEKSEKSS